MKIGPTQEPDDLLRILDVLNPANEPGRITLISRMGPTRWRAKLPPLLRAVERGGAKVVWLCDPMHGNTISTVAKLKTRNFDSILSEVRRFFDIHAAEGTWAGGVHVEMTGQNVTECTGGAHPADRGGPDRALRDVLRSAAERRAVAGAGVPGGRGTEAAALARGPVQVAAQ